VEEAGLVAVLVGVRVSDVRAYVDEDLAHDVDRHRLLGGVGGVYIVVCAIFAQGISSREYKGAKWVESDNCPGIVSTKIIRWCH
jgi:hypothetical protein